MPFEEIKQSILEKHPEAAGILNRQVLLNVKFLNRSEIVSHGEIIVDKDLSRDIKDLFDFLLEIKFKLTKVVPVQLPPYNCDDNLSMADDNTSAMNFRYVANEDRLSLHSFGFAIDINPWENPWQKDGVTMAPQGATRDLTNPQVFTPEHPVVKFMEQRGWFWGANFSQYQDYHHFQKPIETEDYLKLIKHDNS